VADLPSSSAEISEESTMRKVLQISVLLFAVALVVAVAPAAPLPFHSSAAILAAQTAPPTLLAQAQDSAQQNPPAAQPPDQNPPNDQNPNATMPAARRGRLPRTASPLPELILIGFFSLLGIVAVRRFSRSSV